MSALSLVALCACGESFTGEPPGRDAGAGGSGGGAPTLVLNEVDYDNPDLDIAEFAEIINVSGTEQSLDGLALVLVNGAPGENAEYARVELSGTLPKGGFALIASASVAGNPSALRFELPGAENQIQNAGTGGDAVGLIALANRRLLDALSYGGSVLGATVHDVGIFDFVEGEPTSVVDDGGGSLVRLPDGRDTDDAAQDWKASTTPTPGFANVP
jgi:hypothetical protein